MVHGIILWFCKNVWFILQDYVTTGRRDIYNLMCSIEAHNLEHPTVNYDAGSGIGILPTPDLS